MTTPTKIEFILLDTNEEDIQCMHVFLKCLEIMDSAPPQHRRAALLWMRSIIDSTLENII